MTTTKQVIVAAKRGKKPTRFRFKGALRFGFRRNKVVEIVKFKQLKGGKK